MAAKILANLVVMGSSILARAFVQAYHQALSNASKNGIAQEAVQNIKRASKTMKEACKTDSWCDRGFIMGRNCAEV